MAIAFDNFGSTPVTTSVSSLSLDITAATAGAVCYAWVAVGSSNAGAPSIAATGWTTVQGAADSTTAEYAVLRRVKQSGDTTFTVTWTTAAHAEAVWASWTGVNTSTPDESSAIATNGVTSRTAVPTPTATPTAADRWAVGFFSARTSTSANKNITWTPDAAQTERVDANNSAGASSPWAGSEIADTAAAVTQAAHSYTATHAPAAESHDGSAILFLIPAAPTTPNGTVQPPATVPLPRRQGTRVTWHGFVSATTNPAPGTVPPHPVVARRSAARAVWKGFVSATANHGLGNPPGGAVYRRKAARAIVHGNPGSPPSPRGTVPPHLVVARRTAARAFWRPTGTKTSNTPYGAQPGGLVRRRAPARALWSGTTVRTTNSPPVRGKAPLHLVVARRSASRAVWSGTTVRTANALQTAALLSSGLLFTSWQPGRTFTSWSLGLLAAAWGDPSGNTALFSSVPGAMIPGEAQPGSNTGFNSAAIQASAGQLFTDWQADLPFTSWQAGQLFIR